MITQPTELERNHIALHLAHRWFAFLEAPGGDLNAHLQMFHPQVRLTGHRGSHLFASDHETLIAWFDAVPDEISSHHIVHSNYSEAANGDGILNMVVAYQAGGDGEVHGSIISYETRIEFAPGSSWFITLDKTPILPNTKSRYQTSWSTNRVLALVHADLGGFGGKDRGLRSAFGGKVGEVIVQATASEGSRSYNAIVGATVGADSSATVLSLKIEDNVLAPIPIVTNIEMLAPS